MYKKLADIVRIIHDVYIIGVLVLVFLCIALAFISPDTKTCKLAWLILVAYIGTAFTSEVVLGSCPLRLLEESLRRRDNPNFSYNGSFAAYRIAKIFKIAQPRAIVITISFMALVVISVVVFVGMIVI